MNNYHKHPSIQNFSRVCRFGVLEWWNLGGYAMPVICIHANQYTRIKAAGLGAGRAFNPRRAAGLPLLGSGSS